MIRTGLIGTGRIAKRFVPEARCVNGIEITAVYNPHEGSAERFIESVSADGGYLSDSDGLSSVPEAVTDLRELWDRVDAVYIASPHETHFGYIMAALEAGRHVLCEKPMVLSEAEARECFKMASEKGLILMEGLKTTYCPGYRKVLQLAKSGTVGEIKYIESCFTKLEKKDKRELTDREYGGSFTELGSYVLLPFFDLFFELLKSGADDISFSSITDDSGLDIFTKADFFSGDCMASAKCGLGVKAEGSLIISGTKGFIKVDAPWWKTGHFEVHFEDPGKVQVYDEAFEGDGLRYEIREFAERIEGSGSYDPLNDRERSVFLSGVMERFLRGRGVS